MTEKGSKVKKEKEAAIATEEPNEASKDKKRGETITLLENGELLIGDRKYALVKNYREAFDAEQLGLRYSDVLARYDYIVGDWGFEQLRLKGFFDQNNRKVLPDQRIDTLEDYLYEYCNFGCAYFVLACLESKKEKAYAPARKRNKKPYTQQAFTNEKRESLKPKKEAANQKQNADTKGRAFTIRKREEK